MERQVQLDMNKSTLMLIKILVYNQMKVNKYTNIISVEMCK